MRVVLRPNLKSHEEAIELILKAIENAGYRPGDQISISLDAAASEFFENGVYKMQGGKELSSSEMVQYYRFMFKVSDIQYRRWTR